MTKHKQVFRNISKCITNNKRNTTFTSVFRPFTQYFVEAPLAAITASSLLGYDATRLAPQYLGSFSADPLKLCQLGCGA